MRAVVVRAADEVKRKLVNIKTAECNATYLYPIASDILQTGWVLFICSFLEVLDLHSIQSWSGLSVYIFDHLRYDKCLHSTSS